MQSEQGMDLVESIINDVRTHVLYLKDLSILNAKIQRMTGITNETYMVEMKDSDLAPVIYRRFGESQTNIFLDRDTQKIIYNHVSDQGLGPKIYCYIGEHTRIEQFIQSKVLKSNDMLAPQVIPKVAYTLQKFHSMSDPASIERKSLIQSVFFQRGQKLMHICHDKMNKDIYTQRQKHLIQIFRTWINNDEIQFIRQAVKPLQKDSLIFSHNDLLANNILIAKDSGKYIFIDYEYSTYNFAIFDIANYFNQNEFDYDNKEPPYFGINKLPENLTQLREKFIECYCLAEGKKYNEYLKALEDEGERQKVKQKTERLMKQFILGSMLSNIMWGWWAVIVCKNPNVTFDYLEFCKVRYDNYQKAKKSSLWKIDQ